MLNAYQGRGGAYRKLERFSEAAKDLDAALQLDVGKNNLMLRWQWAMVLAYLGEHAKAVAEAEDLLKTANLSMDMTCNVAAIWARAAIAQKDPKISEQYQARAVAALRLAMNRGLKSADYLEKSSELEPLRTCAAYQQLLAELRKKAGDPK